MQIQVDTVYSRPVLTAMARALRKTLRRKKALRTRALGGVLILVAVCTIAISYTYDHSPLTVGSMAVLALTLLGVMIWEDTLNGLLARRQILAGTETVQTTFSEDSYCTVTRAARSEWQYSQIQHICQSADYLILLLDSNHAQVCDKAGFSAGTPEQLISLLVQKTGREITPI